VQVDLTFFDRAALKQEFNRQRTFEEERKRAASTGEGEET